MYAEHVIRDAVKLTLALQKTKQVKKLRSSLSWQSYLREYCTVKICLPRQTGHTTGGIKVLGDLFARPIVISPNRANEARIKELGGEVVVVQSVRGISFAYADAVMIDLDFMFSASKIDEIYSAIPIKDEPFIILRLQ
jgi:hypothetical protein